MSRRVTGFPAAPRHATPSRIQSLQGGPHPSFQLHAVAPSHGQSTRQPSAQPCCSPARRSPRSYLQDAPWLPSSVPRIPTREPLFPVGSAHLVPISPRCGTAMGRAPTQQHAAAHKPPLLLHTDRTHPAAPGKSPPSPCRDAGPPVRSRGWPAPCRALTLLGTPPGRSPARAGLLHPAIPVISGEISN